MKWVKELKRSRIFHILAIALLRLYSVLIFSTCKFEVKIHSSAEVLFKNRKLFLFSLWHSRIFVFPKFIQKYGSFAAVVSSHNDGEFLSQLIESYGHTTSRGSSHKNSYSAMRGLLKCLDEKKSVIITPDGPRGPRFQINGNITTLAKKYNIPLVIFSYSAKNAIVLKTWDRFLIPLPFQKIYISIDAPIPANNIESNHHLAELMLEQTVRLDKKSNLTVDY